MLVLQLREPTGSVLCGGPPTNLMMVLNGTNRPYSKDKGAAGERAYMA